MLVKPFIAVLMLYSKWCSSDVLVLGEHLILGGRMDVHGPHCGWSMRQALAMLLVPDIPLTDKKTVKKSLCLNFYTSILALHFNI